MHLNTKKIIITSLFAAIIFVITRFTAFPLLVKSGYVNAGDAVLLLGSYVLGGPLGALAAAIGSALADLAYAAAVYAPATFVIKGLMALAAAFLFGHKAAPSMVRLMLGLIMAELIMIGGYFLYEIFLLGTLTAVADLLGSTIQAVFNIVVAFIILQAVKRIPSIQSLRISTCGAGRHRNDD